MLRWNKHGLYFKVRGLEIALYVDRQRSGILIRLWRIHIFHNEKIDKLNHWLKQIIPEFGPVEVYHNDARCLVIDIPGPIGAFWWCLQP